MINGSGNAAACRSGNWTPRQATLGTNNLLQLIISILDKITGLPNPKNSPISSDQKLFQTTVLSPKKTKRQADV